MNKNKITAARLTARGFTATFSAAENTVQVTTARGQAVTVEAEPTGHFITGPRGHWHVGPCSFPHLEKWLNDH